MGDPQRQKTSLNIREFIGRHIQDVREAQDSLRGFRRVRTVKYTEGELWTLLGSARVVFEKQKTLAYVKLPAKVVGDIHGQYRDLLRVFNLEGKPPGTRYVFLGDYVDRGQQSLECIALLLAYKVLYPKRLWLLRGNHECANINRIYGFYDEIIRRFDSPRLWSCFQTVFDMMPLAGIIGGRILCMHGGISQELDTLHSIKNLKRPLDYTNFMKNGLACDLLWADPDYSASGWKPSLRGISCIFGKTAVFETLERLNIDLIVRAHQVVRDGFQFFANKKVITVFTAVNYCNEFDNKGAVLIIKKDLELKFRVLDALKLPNAKPTPIGSAASDP